MNKISEHITYDEATKSVVAIKYGIDNTPNENQLKNMILLAEQIFEPIRNYFDTRIAVTSFFRSKKLNSKLKGSKNSQHMSNNGSAIDIDADVYGIITNGDIFNYVKNNLIFDQLIMEFPKPDGNPEWVHISYNEGNNRKQIFIATKDEKQNTVYTEYSK